MILLEFSDANIDEIEVENFHIIMHEEDILVPFEGVCFQELLVSPPIVTDVWGGENTALREPPPRRAPWGGWSAMAYYVYINF